MTEKIVSVLLNDHFKIGLTEEIIPDIALQKRYRFYIIHVFLVFNRIKLLLWKFCRQAFRQQSQDMINDLPFEIRNNSK